MEWWRNSAGIYAITNTVTGEQYIVQSVDVRMRMKSHRAAMVSGSGDSRYNRRLVEACMRYGVEAFTFTVVERIPDSAGLEWLTVTESDYRTRLQPAYNIVPAGKESAVRYDVKFSRDTGEDEMQMVTLGDACTQLGVTRRTLDKWLRRFNVTPTKHEHDTRFHLIPEEVIDQIREARAQMPPTHSKPVSRFTPLLDPLPSIPATPRPVQRVVASSSTGGHSPGHHDPLPEGWVAAINWLDRELGVAQTTARRYLDTNQIPHHTGEWDSGNASKPFLYALDLEQQEEARLFVARKRSQ